MLDALITSKMRVRILMRLFLNQENHAYLRELVSEFGASPGHVNKELGLLMEAGLLSNEQDGRRVDYRANTEHPLFPELQSMVRKALGMDRVLDSIIERVGSLVEAWLVGDYARGVDSGVIDLVLVGDVDEQSLEELVKKAERHIQRQVRTAILTGQTTAEFAAVDAGQPKLLLWRASPEDKR